MAQRPSFISKLAMFAFLCIIVEKFTPFTLNRKILFQGLFVSLNYGVFFFRDSMPGTIFKKKMN